MPKPWNCPKGYGTCWTCNIPCNEPGSHQRSSESEQRIEFTNGSWRKAFWAGFILGALLGYMLNDQAHAGEGTYVGTTAMSKHINPGREYNERHWPSVFVEHHFKDSRWNYQAGTYRNSFGCQTWYAMSGYELWRWKFFAMVDHEIAVVPAIGAGTGYENCDPATGKADHELSPMLGVVLEWRVGRHVGLNIFLNTAVAALQPKKRIDR